jgi:hypothetical protein
MVSRVLEPSSVSNLAVSRLNMELMRLMRNVLVGEELAFIQIQALCIAISSIIANSICSLIISPSCSANAKACLISSTSCEVAPCFVFVDLLCAFFLVIPCLSFTISFQVALSTRSGTESGCILSEACCVNLLQYT